jgi:arachidonate 15-lipoxygenase (second type)/8-lipoxygenase (S-type)
VNHEVSRLFKTVLFADLSSTISARPLIANSNRSLLYMFDDPEFLRGTNNATRSAAEKFKEEMDAFSKEIQGRRFDKNGLSQGAPFIWRALDPKEAPFSLSI